MTKNDVIRDLLQQIANLEAVCRGAGVNPPVIRPEDLERAKARAHQALKEVA